MKKAQIPKFNDKQEGEYAKIWLEEVEMYFSMENLSTKTKTMWATYNFLDIVLEWWNAYKIEHGV